MRAPSTVLWVLLGLIVLGGGYYFLNRKPPPGVAIRGIAMQPFLNKPSRLPNELGSAVPSANGVTVAGESRMVATLAAQTGPFTVSYRTLRSDAAVRAQSPPGMAPPGALGPFTLWLQVTGDETQLSGCRLDFDSVKALDNTGRALGQSRKSDDIGNPITFPGGCVWYVRMQAPANDASTLKSVVGRLLVRRESGNEQPYDFRIEDIPLPNGPRLFGRIAARSLSPARLSRLDNSLTVGAGSGATELVRDSEPVRLPSNYAVQYLILGPGLPSRLRIPTPVEGEEVGIQANIGPMGVIDLKLSHRSRTWHGKVWDGESVFVVLPAARGMSRRAFVLRLSRSPNQSDSAGDAVPLFPPVDGSPGGSIATRVCVGAKSFGKGFLRVQVSRKDGSRWGEPRSAIVQVQEPGDFILTNLAAGEYRISHPASGLIPALSTREQPATLEDYLNYRFGVRGGSWSGESIDRVEVRAGQVTETEPLRWQRAIQRKQTRTESPER